MKEEDDRMREGHDSPAMSVLQMRQETRIHAGPPRLLPAVCFVTRAASFTCCHTEYAAERFCVPPVAGSERCRVASWGLLLVPGALS